MPIHGFHPHPGTVLLCDFDRYSQAGASRVPEIMKRRPVIVFSRRETQAGTCLVVPLSTAVPRVVRPYHHCIRAGTYPFLHGQQDSWAKCDMLSVVAYYRLDRLDDAGKWTTPRIALDDLRQIWRSIQLVLPDLG